MSDGTKADDIALAEGFTEFLTLPAYERLLGRG